MKKVLKKFTPNSGHFKGFSQGHILAVAATSNLMSCTKPLLKRVRDTGSPIYSKHIPGGVWVQGIRMHRGTDRTGCPSTNHTSHKQQE